MMVAYIGGGVLVAVLAIVAAVIIKRKYFDIPTTIHVESKI